MPQYLGLDFYALAERERIDRELGIETEFNAFIPYNYKNSDRHRLDSINTDSNVTKQSQPQSVDDSCEHLSQTPIVIKDTNLDNIRRNHTINRNVSTVCDVNYGANTAAVNHGFQTKLSDDTAVKMEIISQTLDNDNLKSKYFSEMSNKFKIDTTYKKAKTSDIASHSRVIDTPVQNVFGGKWHSRTQSPAFASKSFDKPMASTPFKSQFTMNSQLDLFEQSVRSKTIRKTAENLSDVYQIKRNRSQFLSQIPHSQPISERLNKPKPELQSQQPISFNFGSSQMNRQTFEKKKSNNSGNTTIINQNFNFFNLHSIMKANVSQNVFSNNNS